MKKNLLLLLLTITLFISCSSDDDDVEIKQIEKSEEELIEEIIKDKIYTSDDLQVGNTCLGLLSIMFSRTDDNKLIISTSDINCEPTANIFGYEVDQDQLIIYKSDQSLHATLKSITETSFIYESAGGNTYLFEYNESN